MKTYLWCRGLLQGDRLSSSLCELYMSYQDNIHFKFILGNLNCFFYRTVDDYMFCSTNRAEVVKFVEIITNNYNINENKIQSNLPEIQLANANNMLRYAGQVFNLSTKHVMGNFSFNKKTCMHYKFSLWNENRQYNTENFLRNSLNYSANNFHFKKLEMNTIFNSKIVVLQNYYNGMLYLAYKFNCAVHSSYTGNLNNDLIHKLIITAIKVYANNTFNKLKLNKGTEPLTIDKKSLHVLGYLAFISVLKRRQAFYNEVCKKLKRESKRIKLKYKVNLKEASCNDKLFLNINIGYHTG